MTRLENPESGLTLEHRRGSLGPATLGGLIVLSALASSILSLLAA